MKIIVNPPAEQWKELFLRPSQDDESVRSSVASIISRVREGGDAALRAISFELDRCGMENMMVSEEEYEKAEQAVSQAVKDALRKAADNISAFHRAQMPHPVEIMTCPGVKCIQKAVPIEKVGLYIPGGTAPLFSTVLMLALPARIAACREVVLCTPAREGRVAPEILFAARLCGVSAVYKIGGAQAIAAMAYGTETVPKVDKIFGPGNRYVTTAKQILGNSAVAIDMPAGPSEVMVIADGSSEPDFIAADLLSQAEHGPDSQVVLVCDREETAFAVMDAVSAQTRGMEERGCYIDSSLSKSFAVVFKEREKMLEFANAYAPEHLIISTEDPWSIAEGVTSAGSVFVGKWSPESAGDYASGTNHTLPTCAWAKSYSGVNLDSYMKKITFQELSRDGLQGLSETIITMAEAEGLAAHANAVKIRMKDGIE